jgi:hypothetical protein
LNDLTPRQNSSPAARLRTGVRVLFGAVRPPAQYGVSYPKSGRTWLRAMMGSVLGGRTGLPESEVLNTRSLTAAAGLPIMKWHHGGGSLKSPSPAHDALSFDPRFKGKGIIFMMRDPRDTLVSAYFQSSKRIQSFEGEIGEFVRSSERGIRKWIAYHNLWHAHRPDLRSFHLVRYESLHADPAGTLRGVLEAIGLRDVTDEELAQAVEFARFENLKKLEATAGVRAGALRPKDQSDPDSFKVRKGRVGGYRQALSPDDIDFIEEALRRTPCPLYLEHYPRGQGSLTGSAPTGQ